MEYVNGFALPEYFKRADVASIRTIAEKFLDLVPTKHVFDSNAKDIFSRKIAELEQKIDTRGNKNLKKAFSRLKGYEWEYCVAGRLHGDLSLENVIWKDGELYLIDFLDSFYDSWMIDFAKLIFDADAYGRTGGRRRTKI